MAPEHLLHAGRLQSIVNDNKKRERLQRMAPDCHDTYPVEDWVRGRAILAMLFGLGLGVAFWITLYVFLAG
ncbi:hypothetical protein [Novosphingobium sp. MD-1]|uniref:hypothetical protein n=1 Tax=Novosphingobium sp. MD-1 TaxID=1630648 RepID=UPI000F7F2BFB|nr:hypothetical protein [Novosphingobium sp. MD-1]